MAIGSKFFLFLLVSDRVWFDGFECFRISDISDLRPDPYTSFVEAALRKRGERKPRTPRINLKNIGTLLQSANDAFPLVTIHLESVDPDVCYIGRIVHIGAGSVSLLGIDCNARWDTKPDEFRLRDITRINFGGDYEDALHIVGGTKP